MDDEDLLAARLVIGVGPGSPSGSLWAHTRECACLNVPYELPSSLSLSPHSPAYPCREDNCTIGPVEHEDAVVLVRNMTFSGRRSSSHHLPSFGERYLKLQTFGCFTTKCAYPVQPSHHVVPSVIITLGPKMQWKPIARAGRGSVRHLFRLGKLENQLGLH